MKAFIEFVLQNSLPEGTDFQVEESTDEIGVVFTIVIPEELRGIIIGKGGRNIKAIRDVASIIARRENKRVFIKIAD